MKRALIYLNGMKSRCFVLLACLSFVVAATSCSNDKFETNLPEEQKQYTKAELIEQALSRQPKTRANSTFITMVTINDSVRIQWSATENIIINWDNEMEETIPAGSHIKPYIFTNNNPSHSISLSASFQAINNLTIDNNGIIFLNAPYNEKLAFVSCNENYLDELSLMGCPNIQGIYISHNEFSSIDLTQFPKLQIFQGEHNRFTNFNISTNTNLWALFAANNRITNLDVPSSISFLDIKNNPIRDVDLTNNTRLTYLDLSYTSITELDLTQNKKLVNILLESTPLKRLNNHNISDSSFAIFSNLEKLNIAYTPFNALDLSKNPFVFDLNIAGTNITKLDLSNLKIQYLHATRSQLTDLICSPTDLMALYELQIERTPFENIPTNMTNLSALVPDRNDVSSGHLYTYYLSNPVIISEFKRKNWLINQ